MSHLCFLLAIAHEPSSYFFDSATELPKIGLTKVKFGVVTDMMIIVLQMSASARM